jgi:hypothetical protein
VNKRTHLDNLEVLKNVVYILTNHHRIVSVLSIQVFPLVAFGIRFHLMLDVMKVLLELLLCDIPLKKKRKGDRERLTGMLDAMMSEK